MKSLVATALFLTSHATLEETSLMQGLLARHSKISPESSSRKDATTKLMETAMKMMKNGATPDVVTFIETTITEVNSNVLGAIVQEHHRDQQLIWDLLARFDVAIDAMEACAASITVKATEKGEANTQHQMCRSDEAISCARSRKCQEELEELWTIVKIEEEEMRRIHWAIHGEWCVGPAPPHPGVEDPFQWTLAESWEGPETSQSTDPYPAIDYTPAVIEFRRFSVEYFGLYIIQKPRVELAWENYWRKQVECAALEETWELKMDECDVKQTTVHDAACEHAHLNRQCVSDFGHEYHMTMTTYLETRERIEQLEYDRKREWETLHIVTCLLETVYTHVIHSIETDEPCPTTESHPEQTQEEINYCHVVEESMTRNLTIDYGTPPDPPLLPPPPAFPCTAQYVWEEHGSFQFQIQQSHGDTIANEGLQDYFTILSAFGWAGCAAPRACTPCESPDLIVDPAYVENEVCKPHHIHLRPGQMDMDTFKCLSGNECVKSMGRCNGVSNCDDGSDELGCDTEWGLPAVLQDEVCQEPFVSDVQFQCGDGSCTHIAGRCNGINNCADGSDEAGCATTTTGVTIESSTGFTATIETPAISTAVFTDRTYIIDSLGSFTGHSMIKMSNEDKHIKDSHVQMKVRLPQPMTVYVNKLDNTELPWLASEGWAATALTGISYHGVRQTPHTDWSGVLNEDHYSATTVYQKTFTAGTAEIRGNGGGSGSYVMFVANPANPPTPPAGDLWDQHLGMWSAQSSTDRVKCNNNVDMEYVADQAACQALAVANGHSFYSFRHNGENAGHKCMSSSHCNDYLDDRTNEWFVYIAPNGASEYIGCFVDDGARDLGAMLSGTGGPHNTFELCRAACGSHIYMSLQYGGECFCSNEYGTASQYVQVDDSECGATNEPCFSNSHNCGGTWRQAIYQINEPVRNEGQCTGRYEAEAATLVGAVVHANTASEAHAGFVGSSFVDYLNPTGDYVEWDLPSCSGGTATLDFRYALAGGNRPLQVLVNGVEAIASLSFPATGAWNRYGHTSVTVTLTAGNNVVRLVTTGSSGANVDMLAVQSGVPAYYFSGYGGASCPAGKSVDTYEECESALMELEAEVGPVWTGTYSPIPGVCSTREHDLTTHTAETSSHMHFNGNPASAGNGRSDLTPVCKV